jgi:protein-serine/threonine kinase
VEYVAPQSQTVRGETTANTSPKQPSASRTNAPAGPRGMVDQNKPLPSEPPGEPRRAAYTQSEQEARLDASIPRSRSESAGGALGSSQNTRPNTGHSATSLNAGRLPSRGSYGQPVAPTVAATNAQGRLAQPKTAKPYSISAPIPQDSDISIGRPSTHQLPNKFNQTPAPEPVRTHKRSSTVSSIGERIFGRSGSLFGGRQSQQTTRPKTGKRYPPTSMRDPYAAEDTRASIDSRRSNTITRTETRPRRFSLINSLRGLSSRSDQNSESDRDPQETEYSRPATGPGVLTGRDVSGYGGYSGSHQDEAPQPQETSYEAHIDRQFAQLHENNQMYQGSPDDHEQPVEYNSSDRNEYYGYPNQAQYSGNFDGRSRPSAQLSRNKQGVLQKNNRKFADAYEYERDHSHHSGSSGAARKVMDFFRRRGKARAGEDR